MACLKSASKAMASLAAASGGGTRIKAVVVLEEGIPASGIRIGAAAVSVLALPAGCFDGAGAGLGVTSCWGSSRVIDEDSFPAGRRGVCGAEGGDGASSSCGAGALSESGNCKASRMMDSQRNMLTASKLSCLGMSCSRRRTRDEDVLPFLQVFFALETNTPRAGRCFLSLPVSCLPDEEN